MKKIFSLLILLSMVGATAVFAQEEAAEKAPPQLKISGSVDTGFYLGTTSATIGTDEKDDDRLFFQNADGSATKDRLNFNLTDDERFGVKLEWTIEGKSVNNDGGPWGDSDFQALGWINFLEKKLKVTAGTNGLDFDISHLPVDLTAGVHFNFPGSGDTRFNDDGTPQDDLWTAAEFFSETELVVGYTMPDLFSAGITFNLDGSGDDSALYDDGWVRDLSTWVTSGAAAQYHNLAWGKGAPKYDPTAMKLAVNFSLKAIKDLTADLDLTAWNLGSKSGKLFKDDGSLNGGNIYKNAVLDKVSFHQKGLAAMQIHAKLGYKLLDGKLGLTLDPTFAIYFAEKPAYSSSATDKQKAYLDARYAAAFQIVPAVSYALNDAMTAGLDFGYRTKFGFVDRISVKPSLSWKVLSNATLGFSFELVSTSDGTAVADYEESRDSNYENKATVTTKTGVTFGFTF
jgi:hypothetical protein